MIKSFIMFLKIELISFKGSNYFWFYVDCRYTTKKNRQKIISIIDNSNPIIKIGLSKVNFPPLYFFQP